MPATQTAYATTLIMMLPNDQRERRETAATGVRIQSGRNGCLPFARRFGSAI